jgi:hypothetical protein
MTAPKGSSNDRDKFVNGLVEAYQSVDWKRVTGGPPSTLTRAAQELARSITGHRSTHGEFPNNSHWKLLEGFLKHRRFVQAIASNCLTPSYLAGAEDRDLRCQIDELNRMTEDAFSKWLQQKSTTSSDPNVSPAFPRRIKVMPRLTPPMAAEALAEPSAQLPHQAKHSPVRKKIRLTLPPPSSPPQSPS